MNDVDFTDDEICKELEDLGYANIPPERFQQFKDELFQLIRQERSSCSSSNTSLASMVGSARPPLASSVTFDKENVTYEMRGNGQAAGSCASNMHADTRNGDVADQDGGILDSLSNHSSGRFADWPDKRSMKRKVLRKVDGQVSISESFTESESNDIASLQERLRMTSISQSRPVSAPPVIRRSVSSDQVTHQQLQRPHTSCREPSLYNLPDDYQGPKALIRPMSCDPHVKNIKKADPVARYQLYQNYWTACRAPGEKAHKQLRWGVREKMLYHGQVVEKKPQHCHQPNSYVIPSDKKRKSLRWQIRMDLAQGVKPPSMFD